MATIEERRKSPDALVRLAAAWDDSNTARDLAWAREDPNLNVRLVAAWADCKYGRDLAWARADQDVHVRFVAENASNTGAKQE